MVDVLSVRASGLVLERSSVRLCKSSSSTSRKGRYLLPLLDVVDGAFTFNLILVSEGGPLSLSLFAESERLLARS